MEERGSDVDPFFFCGLMGIGVAREAPCGKHRRVDCAAFGVKHNICYGELTYVSAWFFKGLSGPTHSV